MKCTPLLSNEYKKNSSFFVETAVSQVAGAEGLEPSTKVLETHVLPLHHTPMSSRDFYIISQNGPCVKGNLKIILHIVMKGMTYHSSAGFQAAIRRSSDQAAFAGLVDGRTSASIPVKGSR